MIAHIRGVLIQKKPAFAVVDVQGVGYRLFISLSTFYSLPDEGEAVSLDVYTVVREDAFSLFGFMDKGEKELFEMLIGVNKVGPKLAITILSGIPFAELAKAVSTGDTARLSAIPGIGKKTAQRLIMELGDRMKSLELTGAIAQEGGPDKTPVVSDAIEAMVTLGYKKKEAEKVVEEAGKHLENADLETLLKEALKTLG